MDIETAMARTVLLASNGFASKGPVAANPKFTQAALDYPTTHNLPKKHGRFVNLKR